MLEASQKIKHLQPQALNSVALESPKILPKLNTSWLPMHSTNPIPVLLRLPLHLNLSPWSTINLMKLSTTMRGKALSKNFVPAAKKVVAFAFGPRERYM